MNVLVYGFGISWKKKHCEAKLIAPHFFYVAPGPHFDQGEVYILCIFAPNSHIDILIICFLFMNIIKITRKVFKVLSYLGAAGLVWKTIIHIIGVRQP